MSRGSARKRKIKAWTTKANHGRKPAKGKTKGWPKYKEIMDQHKNKYAN